MWNDVLTTRVAETYIDIGSAPSTDVSFTTAFSHSDHDHDNELSDASRSSSRASSSMHDSWSENIEYPRHVSPPPPDEHAHNVRDERRYRLLLQHEFHPSRMCLSNVSSEKMLTHALNSNAAVVDTYPSRAGRRRVP